MAIINIDYPPEFNLETDLGSITLPPKLTTSFIWHDSFVEIIIAAQGELQDILQSLSSAGFDISGTLEKQGAPQTAKQWFLDHPGAIDFIRLTPTEQEVQIDAMTNTQLKELLKYLTIAVSALIKERYL